MTRDERLAHGLTAASVVAVYVAAGAEPGHRVTPYLMAHALLLAGAAAACGAVTREPAALGRVLWAGLAVRCALIPVAPFTTTDVGRYLWDGAVLLAGEDPYALTPVALELVRLRGSVPLPTDHLDVATCYPPMALAVFALAALAGARAMLAWKVLCAVASAISAGVITRLAASRGGSSLAPLTLLGPVAVLEAGVGAHLETFVALAAVLMIDAALRERWDRAAVAGGVIVALKLVPGIVVLPLVFRAPRPVRFALVATLPFTISFGLAELAGLTAPGSLPTVATHWSFGSPVWTALYERFPTNDDVIRPALAVIGALGVVGVALRRRELVRDTVTAAGVSLAVSPVIYPWYGAIVATLLPLAPRRWALAALALMPCTYEVLDDFQAHQRWTPARWPLVLLMAATLLGLVADWKCDRKDRSKSGKQIR